MTPLSESWIVDPSRKVVDRYRLRGDTYPRPSVAGESVTVSAIEGVEIDLRAVWLAAAAR